jgi:cell division septation protein DedD
MTSTRATPIPRALLASATLVGALLVCGCGIRDPYRGSNQSLLPPISSANSSAGTPPATTAPATTPTTATTAATTTTTTTIQTLKPATAPGTPGTARSVIYQFALAYGNLSDTGAARRQRTLASLSTRVYARGIEAPDDDKSDVARGLQGPVRAVARVISIQLAPIQGDYENAVVELQQALEQANGTIEQPFPTTFEIGLLHEPGGWRVASFTAQS